MSKKNDDLNEEIDYNIGYTIAKKEYEKEKKELEENKQLLETKKELLKKELEKCEKDLNNVNDSIYQFNFVNPLEDFYNDFLTKDEIVVKRKKRK